MDQSRLVSYIDLRAERFRIDLKAARLFVGTSDIGDVSENAVRKFLVSLLPQKYSVGVGEAIASDGTVPTRKNQSQQKDIIIYDPYGGSILGWDESGINLFPVESIYAVIEIKTGLKSKADLLTAVEQTQEIKRLCSTNRSSNQYNPFTGIFAFESGIKGDTLFEVLVDLDPKDRPDCVFVLDPSDKNEKDVSYYFSHWHYHSRGGGLIDFVSSDATAIERRSVEENPDKRLTFGRTTRALLWFYLFLLQELEKQTLTKPNLWEYANSSKQRLGWAHNE